MKYISLLILFLITASSVEAQITRYVSTGGDDQEGANTCFDSEAPCRSINQAINIASSGDTISIGGGAYTESLTIGKSLTIQGSGEGITIIQAHPDPFTADDRVIIIEGDDGSPQVEISGLTIRHGNTTGLGGGIYNSFATLTLESVTFTANSGRGGGLYNVDSSPTLTNVTFTENKGDFGGAMYTRRGEPVLTNVSFINNTATAQGGGFYAVANSHAQLTDITFEGNHSENRGGAITMTTSSHVVFTNVTFLNNSADFEGGAVRISGNSNPEFYNVTFSGNSTNASGGAISNLDESSPVFTEVTFSNNSAEVDGGGMDHNGLGNPSFTNVSFVNNSAGENGGAIHNYGVNDPQFINVKFAGNSAGLDGGAFANYNGGSPVLLNATISKNTAAGNGGALANGLEGINDSSVLTLINSIIWGNTADANGNEIYNDESDNAEIVLEYSLYRDRDGAGDIVEGGEFTATNSLTDDPLFVDVENDDFRLQPDSPAIGAGDPDTDMSLFATDEQDEPIDLAGNPRVNADTIDLGVYETDSAPAAPELTAPADEADDVDRNPTLQWTSVSGAVSYQVQVSTEDAFSDPVVDSTGIEVSELSLSGLDANTSYFWRVRAVSEDGESAWSATWSFTTNMATTAETDLLPGEFDLQQNYPNPFNPVTVISYQLPEAGDVRLEVFDITGRKVATLVNEQVPAGNHVVTFNASNFSSGVYIYRLQAGESSLSRRMTLIK